MRTRVGDFVRAGVCLLIAVALLGTARQFWREAEAAHRDDTDFTKLAIVENGRATSELKVCGDRYREPDCMRRESVTVSDTGFEANRSRPKYTLVLTRADHRTLELTYRSSDAPRDRDSVYGRAQAGQPVTLFWWRGSVRLIQAGTPYDTATVRTTHYPGRLFTGPAALASLLAGLGLGPLWAAMWLALSGRRHPLAMAWQWLAPVFVFFAAGGVGAFVAWAAPRPRAVVVGFAVTAVVLLVPTLLWLRWWARNWLARAADVEPVRPVSVHAVDGGVSGTGPWNLDLKHPLYVGPDVIGTTPDPNAYVALRPLPGPLRVITVRPPHRSDPHVVRRQYGIQPYLDEATRAQREAQRRGYTSRSQLESTYPLVAVCEVLSGPGQGSRVLIGAPHQDMPEVLGAIAAHAGQRR
ncbi:hypothetical protein [Streptomyces sp. NPDC046821]|uniref:hypothetical protein n=1 Tax=Streptomyces sp. NPDC046821 TaxID=3154702 RepID=UPI0033FF7B67